MRHKSDLEGRFQSKQIKYVNEKSINSVENIIPVIISHNGTIYEKSAKMVDEILGDDIDPVLFYKAVYRAIASAWTSADATTQKATQEAFANEQLPKPRPDFCKSHKIADLASSFGSGIPRQTFRRYPQIPDKQKDEWIIYYWITYHINQ